MPSQTLPQGTMVSEIIQGHERNTYVTLITSDAEGKRDCLKGASPMATESS
jgi:hypothetical protein